MDVWMNATAALPGYASFGLLIGNMSGVIYRGAVGGFNMSATMVNVGAASQWVSAAMVVQMLRANGTVTLDRRAGDFIALPPPLANVTLRQLLSHTAGLDDHVLCSEAALLNAPAASAGLNFSACVDSVRAAYNGSTASSALPTGPVGTKHVFTGAALQLAGAAAMAISAKSFNRFSEGAWAAALATYFVTPLGLRPGTAYFLPADNPSLAGGLSTTANNYGLWLQQYLAGDLLPVSGQWSIYAMEDDATTNVTIVSSALPLGTRYSGWHAGLGA
jgi:CubicO group peptidase (beta-lactamase class C family)